MDKREWCLLFRGWEDGGGWGAPMKTREDHNGHRSNGFICLQVKDTFPRSPALGRNGPLFVLLLGSGIEWGAGNLEVM